MPLNVLWLQSGGCGGCSMSLLCADTQDFAAMLRGAGLHLLWHPALSLEGARGLPGVLDDCLQGRTRLDVLCVEGAMLRGPHGSGRFHQLAGTGRAMIDWVRDLAPLAQQVLAIGSCAAWGGVTAGGTNPTDACGLQFEDDRPGGLLGSAFRSRAALPVVNVAGCPTHPDWVLETLMSISAGLLTPNDLDSQIGRASCRERV